MIPRPDVCDFIFRFLPIIDNHNKLRQHHLALEKTWLTKKPWFRLYTTLIGMSVVDLYRLYCYHDLERWKDYTIQQFADMLCGSGLVRRQRKILPIPLRHAINDNNFLERIADANGDVTKRITEKQTIGKHCRKNAGGARQKSVGCVESTRPNIRIRHGSVVHAKRHFVFHLKNSALQKETAGKVAFMNIAAVVTC